MYLLTLNCIEHDVPQVKPAVPEPTSGISTDDINLIHEDPESDIIEIVRQEQQSQLDIEDDVSPEFANDPLFKLLKELNTSMEAGGDIPTNFDPSAYRCWWSWRRPGPAAARGRQESCYGYDGSYVDADPFCQ